MKAIIANAYGESQRLKKCRRGSQFNQPKYEELVIEIDNPKLALNSEKCEKIYIN